MPVLVLYCTVLYYCTPIFEANFENVDFTTVYVQHRRTDVSCKHDSVLNGSTYRLRAAVISLANPGLFLFLLEGIVKGLDK